VNEDFRGFSVAYQPIVDLETSKLSGFEALLRFSDESGAAITPDEFIPLAEEQGLIQKLGRFVLENALEAQSRFNASAYSNPKFSISINVSPLQLSSSFPTIVREALSRHGADPSLVAIEITENVIIDKSQTTIDVLDELREIGLNISIDDFGAGYATFGSLRQFSFKTLKIDRSFIDTLMTEDGRQIVKAIIDMGRGLGVGVIAEGIETLEQAERLRELCCKNGQGYHFSRPLTYDDAVQSVVREVSINGSHAA
jgi:EAL domain-containing protein (putative c-di-GMP-specific phosphodiesterase class I)